MGGARSHENARDKSELCDHKEVSVTGIIAKAPDLYLGTWKIEIPKCCIPIRLVGGSRLTTPCGRSLTTSALIVGN